MAELSGNSFDRGAVAAGLNEALQKDLGQWEEKYPVEHQIISFLIGAKVDEMAEDDSNIGAVAAVYGTKYNWDGDGHRNIILSLYRQLPEIDLYSNRIIGSQAALEVLEKLEGVDSDAAANEKNILEKFKKKYMESKRRYTQNDFYADDADVVNYMPSKSVQLIQADVEHDNYSSRTGPILSPERHALAKPTYFNGTQEDWREEIVKTCKEHLQAAINGGNSGEGLKNLAIAIHIVADDYAHRQVNAGWSEHTHDCMKRIVYLKPNGDGSWLNDKIMIDISNIGFTDIDNKDYPANRERFAKALEAAKAVNDMYRMKNIDFNKLDSFFPKLFK